MEVLHAFQWKAIQLNKKQNCIVHLIEDAEDEARKRDQVPVKGKTANEKLSNLSHYVSEIND